MADKTVSVTLQGKDNLSPIFTKVGASATAAGKTIENAGKSVSTLDKNATTAAQSMSRFEQATAKAESATSRLGVSGKAVGAALGTAVAGGLLLAVRAAADAEVSQQRLQSTVEATGAIFDQYAAQIDAVNNKGLSLSFDDEDVQDALSGLIQGTGDVTQSLDQMGLAMDIARGRGIDLASASKIVMAADQGRFGALKRLGIQIDENATKETVLASLQQKYAGQAEAYADTNAGAFDRWKNSAENAAEAVGSFLGPAQQLLLVFPGLAAGATLLGSALGPVGIAVAAGLAAFGIYKLITSTEGMVSANEVAAASLTDLEDTIRSLYAAGSELATLGTRATEGIFPNLTKDTERMAELENAIASTNEVIGRSGVETEQQSADLERWGFELGGLTDRYGVLDSKQMQATLTTRDVAAAQDDLNAILRDTGVGMELAQAATSKLFDDYQSGAITAGELVSGLDDIANGLGDYDKQATAATAATENYTASINRALGAVQHQALVERDAASAQHESMAAIEGRIAAEEKHAMILREMNQYEHQNTEEQRASVAVTKAYVEQQERAAMIAREGAAAQHENTEENRASVAALAAHTAALERQAMAGRDTGPRHETLDENRASVAALAEHTAERVANATKAMTDSYNNVTQAVTGTTKALDSGFQVVVGNTNAIAQSAQGVQDWADKLIGAAGVYGTMDDLLARGVITQQNYNDAAAAYTPIAEANARIQDDVLAIQTAQAPVQAELMQQQADYLDSVKAMNPEMQTYTLAMMDSATSTEALNLATSLLGENGDTFAPMVESAANLNPYLASILEQMGLIEQQPDGTYKVTADTADAQSQIDQLIASNNLLIQSEWLIKYDGDASDAEAAYEAAMGDATAWDNLTATSTVDADTSPADNSLEAIVGRLMAVDSTTATPTVSVVDNASGTLGLVAGLLNSLDGRTVTSYINTVSTFSGSSLSPLGYASGGTVPAMESGGTSPYGFSRAAANGMTATLVGERGPEVLMLPGGAQVMNTEGSRSRMRGKGGASIHLEVHGNIYGLADLEDRIVETVSRGWVRANQMHERSMGL